ncbi:methyltransferase domain-containing protein [Azoarcus olearius]|uniref:Biotin synthesis protein n=1 Tax=Azoarcus sp. (strain BH72) TaxID=418699 RepID=A1K6Q3_AZOSB|nr:methyltransferase domain-containing protein [Azoarcus olearius]CAL94508.1 biotin synthesis protein [Azoarcus olearius]
MLEPTARKAAVRRAFDRAADGYDRAADIQRAACDRLAVLAHRHPPAHGATCVIDAGCGTGYGAAALTALCPAASRIGVDFAPAMLQQMRRVAGAVAPVCADIEALPLATGCADALWSSLAMQWCTPARVLAECARVLRPGGAGWIATLGPRTLYELRAAFAEVDGAAHVLDMHDAAVWCAAARGAGLAVLACESAELQAHAPNLRTLLHNIKAVGAQTVPGDRRRAPLGRSAWRRLEHAYEAYRDADGRLPATYDLILLALFRP